MFQTPPATSRRSATDFERAELGGEIAQLRVVESLAAKHQHRIAIDRLPDRVDRRRIHRPGEVDAVGLGGEQRMKLAQFKLHAIFLWLGDLPEHRADPQPELIERDDYGRWFDRETRRGVRGEFGAGEPARQYYCNPRFAVGKILLVATATMIG